MPRRTPRTLTARASVECRHVDLGDADQRQARAGVVDEAVDAAEAPERVGNHRLDVVFLGDVGADEADAEAPFERRAFGLAASGGDIFFALVDKNFRILSPIPLVAPVTLATSPLKAAIRVPPSIFGRVKAAAAGGRKRRAGAAGDCV